MSEETFQTDDEDEKEQFFWLELLSDLGSNRNIEVSNENQHKKVEQNEYFYLSKLENQNLNTSDNGENPNEILLLGKILPDDQSRLGENDEHFTSTKTEDTDDLPRKHSDNKIDQIWADEYPKALELLRSQLLFHKFDVDLESVNENEDDSGFEIINYHDPSNNSQARSDVFIIQVPTADQIKDYNHYRIFHGNNLAKTLQAIVSFLPVEDVSRSSLRFLTNFLRVALQQVKTNAVVSSFLGKISESTVFIADKAQVVGDIVANQSANLNEEGRRHLHRLQQSIEWVNRYWRPTQLALEELAKKLKTTRAEPVKDGDRIPIVTFKANIRDEGLNQSNNFKWKDITTEELFHGKRVVLFAVPGAFTPPYSSTQLFGYEEHYLELKSFGIDEVYCLSVNDAFVMRQWGIHQGLEKEDIDVTNPLNPGNFKKVKLIPDGACLFTRGMGMSCTWESERGFGDRSWRYSAVINNEIIEKLFIEGGVPVQNSKLDLFEVSDAETMLNYLRWHNNNEIEK